MSFISANNFSGDILLFDTEDKRQLLLSSENEDLSICLKE